MLDGALETRIFAKSPDHCIENEQVPIARRAENGEGVIYRPVLRRGGDELGGDSRVGDVEATAEDLGVDGFELGSGFGGVDE